MSGDDLMVTGEYEFLRSQIATLENDEDFSNWESHIVMSDEDCGIAKCDTFKAISIAFLKELGKKWFAFSKMDIGAVDMFTRQEEIK